MVDPIRDAPGISPRWTTSGKTGVGTALSASSQVWFTLSHGIFNKIYYPRIDQACTRDMGLVVTDGWNFFSEEKRTHALWFVGAPIAGRLFTTIGHGTLVEGSMSSTYPSRGCSPER